MSAAPSLERYQSTDTISSHNSYDSDPDNVADYPGPGFPIKPVPGVPGRHPNRAATKIQSLLRGKKGRARAATMRNAQVNEAMFNLADIESILKELEQAYHVFLTGTGFGGIALALMALCRPGDEILVSDNVYGPTKEISQELMKEFKVNAKFYNPDSLDDLKGKISHKTKMILVENPGSNTFEFQDLSKIVKVAKRKKIFTFLDNTW